MALYPGLVVTVVVVSWVTVNKVFRGTLSGNIWMRRNFSDKGTNRMDRMSQAQVTRWGKVKGEIYSMVCVVVSLRCSSIFWFFPFLQTRWRLTLLYPAVKGSMAIWLALTWKNQRKWHGLSLVERFKSQPLIGSSHSYPLPQGIREALVEFKLPSALVPKRWWWQSSPNNLYWTFRVKFW